MVSAQNDESSPWRNNQEVTFIRLYFRILLIDWTELCGVLATSEDMYINQIELRKQVRAKTSYQIIMQIVKGLRIGVKERSTILKLTFKCLHNVASDLFKSCFINYSHIYSTRRNDIHILIPNFKSVQNLLRKEHFILEPRLSITCHRMKRRLTLSWFLKLSLIIFFLEW